MKLKWIFAALVLANIGLWMWASWYQDAPVEETRAARAPVAPEKMRLLNEPGVKLVPRKQPPPANAELTASVAPACFHIGPFPDVDLVARAETRLNELPLTYSRRAEETRSVTGYLVYLPPLSSPKAAERKRQELTRLGFKDHALMQEEGMQNAISLGLFTVEANAASRVRELAAKKIQARIQPFQQTRTRFWLDVAVRAPAETQGKLRQIDWAAKDVQVQEIACPAGSSPPPAKPPGLRDNAPG
ncbi:hypothetical protein SCL_2320 [Sulfuricaulis limicola]|uniref:Sporulation protein n=1 Tax=Sulfuricaulis limicola TaxID=1620215 RepID=A0A1B4XIG8_9GAMM|nr:hypothetical protein [Sulfuricaulis limicola]BAV34603.1 hypothetical protein SCL_2320 [Sulfuricaulis limicola]